jgi:hypothetical protein
VFAFKTGNRREKRRRFPCSNLSRAGDGLERAEVKSAIEFAVLGVLWTLDTWFRLAGGWAMGVEVVVDS